MISQSPLPACPDLLGLLESQIQSEALGADLPVGRSPTASQAGPLTLTLMPLKEQEEREAESLAQHPTGHRVGLDAQLPADAVCTGSTATRHGDEENCLAACLATISSTRLFSLTTDKAAVQPHAWTWSDSSLQRNLLGRPQMGGYLGFSDS